VALAVIFAVLALESSAFLGFPFPGEVAMLLGGVVAFQHRVRPPAPVADAVGVAIIGDTVGFEVRRHDGRPRALEEGAARVDPARQQP
jgi:undecaprenyl-diphosphatase